MGKGGYVRSIRSMGGHKRGSRHLNKNKLPPIPKHIEQLGLDHTKRIRKILDSFENALWLAYLRGKQEGKDNDVQEIMKKDNLRSKNE